MQHAVGDPPSWKSTWRNFFLPRVVDLNKSSQTGAEEWHINCGYMVEIEIEISRPIVEFQYGGRFAIPQPPVALHGAATWWIHCHDPRATWHIALAGRCQLANSMTRNPKATCHIVGWKNFSSAISKIVFAVFCFINTVWALASDGFRIVFDTFVLHIVEYGDNVRVTAL